MGVVGSLGTMRLVVPGPGPISFSLSLSSSVFSSSLSSSSFLFWAGRGAIGIGSLDDAKRTGVLTLGATLTTVVLLVVSSLVFGTVEALLLTVETVVGEITSLGLIGTGVIFLTIAGLPSSFTGSLSVFMRVRTIGVVVMHPVLFGGGLFENIGLERGQVNFMSGLPTAARVPSLMNLTSPFLSLALMFWNHICTTFFGR